MSDLTASLKEYFTGTGIRQRYRDALSFYEQNPHHDLDERRRRTITWSKNAHETFGVVMPYALEIGGLVASVATRDSTYFALTAIAGEFIRFDNRITTNQTLEFIEETTRHRAKMDALEKDLQFTRDRLAGKPYDIIVES